MGTRTSVSAGIGDVCKNGKGKVMLVAVYIIIILKIISWVFK